MPEVRVLSPILKDINGKKYVDLAGSEAVDAAPAAESSEASVQATSKTAAVRPGPNLVPAVAVGPAIHINVEIHIAADASAETVEEIFKNMRRYVLSGDGAVVYQRASAVFHTDEHLREVRRLLGYVFVLLDDVLPD